MATTITVKGFQGTVDDTAMATQFPGVPSYVQEPGDLAVTAVAGQRQVQVAPGTAVAHFVKYTAAGDPQVLNLAQPATGGRWYAVALTRKWSPDSTCVLEVVDTGVTTDGTDATTIAALLTQGSAASTYPAWLRRTPGTTGTAAPAGHHQVLAFVHVRAATTTLQVVGVRLIAGAATVTAENLHALAWLAQLGGAGRASRVAVGPHVMTEQVQSIEAVGNGFGAFVLTGTILTGAPFSLGGAAAAIRLQILGYAPVGRVFGLQATFGRPGLAFTDTTVAQGGADYAWGGTDWVLSGGSAVPGSGVGGGIVDTGNVQEWGGDLLTRVTRQGSRVSLVVAKRVLANPLGFNVLMFTLPPGMRPVRTVVMEVALFDAAPNSGWGGPVGHATIGTDGTFVVQSAAGATVGNMRQNSGCFGNATFDVA